MSNLAAPGDLLHKAPRARSEAHLRRVRLLPCLVPGCWRQAEAAHVRMASLAHGKRHVGIGEKPDDRWTLPLCHDHHMRQHDEGERRFWGRLGVDPVGVAKDLWESRTSPEAMRLVVRSWRRWR